MKNLNKIFEHDIAQLVAIMLAAFTDRLSFDAFFTDRSAREARAYFAFFLYSKFYVNKSQLARFFNCDRNTVMGYVNECSVMPANPEWQKRAYRAKFIWKYALMGAEKRRAH